MSCFFPIKHAKTHRKISKVHDENAVNEGHRYISKGFIENKEIIILPPFTTIIRPIDRCAVFFQVSIY